MKVTYNWLKDFVEIKLPAKALAEKLTMAGLEVTSLEEKEGDFVFELEITANRPDLLSVIGIAREVAAITNKKLKLPKLVLSPQTIVHSKKRIEKIYGLSTMDYGQLSINIEDKKDCPLYTAKIIQDVKVGPSPEWLKKRLELVGCRSVNNVVDITNYILFTWGEPLHAFDLDRLVDSLSRYLDVSLPVIVRRARKGEEIITIDGIKRVLNENILVIASGIETTKQRNNETTSKPVAIAGIMGGKDTEVTEVTKNVLLEAAIFNPITIRRARQHLGLQSESAYRFERGIDLEIVGKAAWQAVELIQKVCGARFVWAKSSPLPKSSKLKVNLDVVRVNKILGTEIPASQIKRILNSLDFKVKPKRKDNFIVEVPSHRLDAYLEIDLIEEIARIFGYPNIPKSLPRVSTQVSVDNTRTLVSLAKNILVGLGLNEVITYGLIDKDLSGSFAAKQSSETVEILNPLSKEQEILRPSLIPSLSQCVAYNLHQKQAYINIFEIAKVYHRAKGSMKEEYVLGIALCGIKSFWFEQGRIQDEAGFLHLKGMLEVLFARLGIAKEEYKFLPQGSTDLIEVYVKGAKIGLLLRLDKEILDDLEIKNKAVFAAEIALERLSAYIPKGKKFVPLARFPGILRDISLILKEDIPTEEVTEAVAKTGGGLLQEVKITDYYKGKQIPAGFKGITLSCFYRSDERTLTEAEINPLHAKISSILVEKFSAQIRA